MGMEEDKPTLGFKVSRVFPLWCLASNEPIQSCCWFIGMLTCKDTHAVNKMSVRLSAHGFPVLCLFSQSSLKNDRA